MIINGDGGYSLLAAYIGGPAAQANWLGPKVLIGKLLVYVSKYALDSHMLETLLHYN